MFRTDASNGSFKDNIAQAHEKKPYNGPEICACSFINDVDSSIRHALMNIDTFSVRGKALPLITAQVCCKTTAWNE